MKVNTFPYVTNFFCSGYGYSVLMFFFCLSDVFQDLLGIPHMDPSQSFESLNEEEIEAIAGASRGSSSAKTLPPEDSVLRSSTRTRSLPAAASQSPEISSYFDDMVLRDVSRISSYAVMLTSICLIKIKLQCIYRSKFVPRRYCFSNNLV